MEHQKRIRQFIQSLTKSDFFNALIVEGPPGWGKTTTVQAALNDLKIFPEYLGSYSTPFHLFSFFKNHSQDVVVVDDTAGLFTSPVSMAILKAATWPQADQRRIIKWGSSQKKLDQDEFEFQGKLIIICNHFPKTADANAVRSRSICQTISFSKAQAIHMISDVARQFQRDKKIAIEVGEFLKGKLQLLGPDTVNLRGLKLGVEIAKDHPDNWQDLLESLLPSPVANHKDLVRELSTTNIPVKEQQRRFEEITGLKRRTFYLLRRELKLARDYER